MAPNLRKSLCAGVLACALGTAHAQAAPSLEDAFWACDYVATTRGTAAAPAETCAAVYDELKAVKFDGDFDELLAWWQDGKPAAHERIAAMLDTLAEPVAATPPEVMPERVGRVALLIRATRAYLAQIAAVLRED